VTDVRIETIGAGAGFFGELARVSLSYDRAEGGAPATLIGKFPTLDPQGRELGNLFGFYEKEARFYDEIAPEAALRTPRCYYGAADVEGDAYLLLLEDLSPLHREGDEVASCSIGDAEAAIRDLARFHAAFWESPRLLECEWLPMVNAPVYQSAEGSYQQVWEPFLQHFGDDLSPEMRRIGSDLRTHIIQIANLIEPAPRTIIHGDFRLDNMFFSGDGAACALTAFDWQIASKGRGVFDVAYFLASCLEPDVRRAHEMRLLHLWHDIVSARDRIGYTFEQALHDYRLCVLYAHVYTVIGLGSLDFANERGMALFRAWLRRRTAAVEELNAGELMPK
jgi:hypothetical protein